MAALVVVLYAFCVVGPHAAVALVHAGNAVHCFSENESVPHQHAVKKGHSHANGGTHEHTSDTGGTKNSDDTSGPVACCGLFSVMAVAVNTEVVLVLETSGEDIVLSPPQAMGDHPPGRIIKPPIT